MEVKKVNLTNQWGRNQKKLDKIEDERSRLSAQRVEKNRENNQKTTEMGKMFMTIDNMFKNLEKEKDRNKKRTDNAGPTGGEITQKTSFDNVQKSSLKAVDQLKDMVAQIQNFKDLKESIRKTVEDKNHNLDSKRLPMDVGQRIDMFDRGENFDFEEKE